MNNRAATNNMTSNNALPREAVVGVFDSADKAERAIRDLQQAGFRNADIGVLVRNKQVGENIAADTGTEAGAGAATGAVTGGVLGGIGGLLVGLGVLAIPGVGPALGIGPLAAALGSTAGSTVAGAAAGAGIGAVGGALIGWGIPENEARAYEQRFQQGNILLTVRAGNARYDGAAQILRSAGAEQIDFAAPNQAAMTPATTTSHNAAATTGQINTAVSPNLTTQPPSGASMLAGAAIAGWPSVRDDYRAYWQARHARNGENWEDFEPVYNFTWTMRSNAHYTGRSWDEVAPDFERNWQFLHPDLSWERYGPLVHDSWVYWSAPAANAAATQPAQ